MDIRSVSDRISPFQIRAALRDMGAEFYGGNIATPVCEYVGRIPVRPGDRRTVRVRIRTVDVKGPGSRTSHSGRATITACWHAWRDALATVYLMDRDAIVRVGHPGGLEPLVYHGADDWLARYIDPLELDSAVPGPRVDQLCPCGIDDPRTNEGLIVSRLRTGVS